MWFSTERHFFSAFALFKKSHLNMSIRVKGEGERRGNREGKGREGVRKRQREGVAKPL
jgi:hypothetical protein